MDLAAIGNSGTTDPTRMGITDLRWVGVCSSTPGSPHLLKLHTDLRKGLYDNSYKHILEHSENAILSQMLLGKKKPTDLTKEVQ